MMTQQQRAWLVGAALASVIIKVCLASLAHNFDVDSYVLVADHVLAGHVVYAETERYNYAPLWSYVVAGCRWLQQALYPNELDGGVRMFHVLIALLLAYVDLLIAGWLAGRYGAGPAAFFLCNPVSWVLTGFHSQFDNLAVYFSLLGVGFALGTTGSSASRRDFILGVVLLGLSLVTKHLLVFFPLWCLMRADINRPRKLALLVFPVALFLLSFAPFCFDGAARRGILDNVFRYEAFRFTGLVPRLLGWAVDMEAVDRALGVIPIVGGYKLIWIGLLCLVGWLLRGIPRGRAVFYYFAALVVFSGQVADQYLAIPLVACAVLWRSPLAWGYSALTLFYLLGSAANIGTVDGFEWLASAPRAIGCMAWWPLVFLLALLVATLFNPRHGIGETAQMEQDGK